MVMEYKEVTLDRLKRLRHGRCRRSEWERHSKIVRCHCGCDNNHSPEEEEMVNAIVRPFPWEIFDSYKRRSNVLLVIICSTQAAVGSAEKRIKFCLTIGHVIVA